MIDRQGKGRDCRDGAWIAADHPRLPPARHDPSPWRDGVRYREAAMEW